MGNPQPTVPVINSPAWSQPNHVYIHNKIGGTFSSFYNVTFTLVKEPIFLDHIYVKHEHETFRDMSRI